jgi:ribosomal protein S18 acetylase RimI-like enzyme
MPSVTVRRASASDLDALLSLYRELAGRKLTAVPADHPTGRLVLEQILAEQTRELAVAVLEGRLVGTADMVIVANLTHRGEPWAVIENVIVTQTDQRRGIGRALLEHLITVAKAASCHKVSLLSGKHRPEAHEFYRSMGFEAVAEGFKLYLDEQ